MADSGSWELARNLGFTVWLDCPTEEIARRLIAQKDQLQSRPLLADISKETEQSQKIETLKTRLEAILGQRKSIYEQSDLVVRQGMGSEEGFAIELKGLIEQRRVSRKPSEQSDQSRK